MSDLDSRTFSALGDRHRLQIVELLAEKGQMTATDIAMQFDITPSAISQHLKILRNAEILEMEKQSQKRLYRINPQTFDAVEAWIQELKQAWQSRLDRLEKVVEEQKRMGDHPESKA